MGSLYFSLSVMFWWFSRALIAKRGLWPARKGVKTLALPDSSSWYGSVVRSVCNISELKFAKSLRWKPILLEAIPDCTSFRCIGNGCTFISIVEEVKWVGKLRSSTIATWIHLDLDNEFVVTVWTRRVKDGVIEEWSPSLPMFCTRGSTVCFKLCAWGLKNHTRTLRRHLPWSL